MLISCGISTVLCDNLFDFVKLHFLSFVSCCGRNIVCASQEATEVSGEEGREEISSGMGEGGSVRAGGEGGRPWSEGLEEEGRWVARAFAISSASSASI